jgi:peptide/nickel transport system substrate-binding protein
MDNGNYWKVRRSGVRSRRRVFGGAAAGGAGLFLAACGGSDSKDSGSSTGNAPAGTLSTPAATSGDPIVGGVLNVSRPVDYSIDAIIDSTSAANTFAAHVYSRLVKFKSNTDPAKAGAYEMEPDLASFEQPDQQTYIFKLNPEAKFHNRPPVNGRKVTAQDVVLSYRRTVTETKNTNKDKLLNNVEGEPTALDDNTVQFKSKKPFAPFLNNLIAFPASLWIYPRELLENDNARQQTPIGSGPWILKNRQASVAWEFEKNPDYFGKDEAGRRLPYLDGVKINVIPEAAQILAQFLGGNLDTIHIEFESLKQVKEQVKDVSIIESRLTTPYYYISPQQRRAPFTDIRLRQALSLSHDRDGLLKLNWEGAGYWNNLVPAYLGDWWLDPKSPQMGEAAKFFQYNPAEAKKLIDAAGFTQQFNFIYSNNAYGDRFNSMALYSADTTKRAGFNLQVVTQDYRSEFITAGKTFFGNYDGVFYAPESPHTDPYGILYNMLYTGNSWNHAGVSDPQADKLIDELALEFDREKRKSISHAIQKLAAEKMYYTNSAGGPSYIGQQRWAKNYRFAPHGYATPIETYATMWIDPKLRGR